MKIIKVTHCLECPYKKSNGNRSFEMYCAYKIGGRIRVRLIDGMSLRGNNFHEDCPLENVEDENEKSCSDK